MEVTVDTVTLDTGEKDTDTIENISIQKETGAMDTGEVMVQNGSFHKQTDTPYANSVIKYENGHDRNDR